MGHLRRALWSSQIVLSSLLVLCSLMTPSVVSSDGGVSNFGNRTLTVVPYSAGFSLSALFLCVAARQIARLLPGQIWAPTVLVVIAVVDLFVLASTYPRHLSVTYSEIHDDLGIALFAYEFVLAAWLSLRTWRYSTALCLVVQIGGSLLGLLSVLKVLHLLYWGQMIGGLGFAALLATAFPRIVERRVAPAALGAR